MNLTKRKVKDVLWRGQKGNAAAVQSKGDHGARRGQEGRGQTQKRLELFLIPRAPNNDWGLENAFLAYTMENNYEGTRADAGRLVRKLLTLLSRCCHLPPKRYTGFLDSAFYIPSQSNLTEQCTC